jgi:hypothetical protein
LGVFEEIPSRPAKLDQGQVIFYFRLCFGVFLVGSAIAWFRWSEYPLWVARKVSLGEFLLGALISGVFLSIAKSATPEANRKRLFGLLTTIILVQLIFDVLR